MMATLRSCIRLVIMATLAILLGGLAGAHAEPGVKADAVLFGQVAALEGPAAALGADMRLGISAAFEEANRAGGVHRRKLQLISYDDGYAPDSSVRATQKLIEQDHVFALIGPVGTTTTKATQPIATEAGVPLIAPFTGADFLRKAELGNVVNVRASYAAETEAWVKHLTEDLKIDRIAILYQDDAFGRTGLKGVEAAMQRRKIKLVATGTYIRDTTAVKTALLEIRRAKPQAVLMVGAYRPMAAFIKVARSINFDPVFVNISFVGATALANELGQAGAGVVVSQVVPFPWDISIPLVRDYQAALTAVDPKAAPGFVSLEGYMAGRLAVMALERVEGEPTRAAFLQAIWSTRRFDLGGVVLNFGPADNQGLDEVFFTVITADGSFRPAARLTM